MITLHYDHQPRFTYSIAKHTYQSFNGISQGNCSNVTKSRIVCCPLHPLHRDCEKKQLGELRHFYQQDYKRIHQVPHLSLPLEYLHDIQTIYLQAGTGRMVTRFLSLDPKT